MILIHCKIEHDLEHIEICTVFNMARFMLYRYIDLQIVSFKLLTEGCNFVRKKLGLLQLLLGEVSSGSGFNLEE